ncbi:hypothetical protein ISCGN_030862 [Ixodes scapularis]
MAISKYVRGSIFPSSAPGDLRVRKREEASRSGDAGSSYPADENASRSGRPGSRTPLRRSTSEPRARRRRWHAVAEPSIRGKRPLNLFAGEQVGESLSLSLSLSASSLRKAAAGGVLPSTNTFVRTLLISRRDRCVPSFSSARSQPQTPLRSKVRTYVG